MNGYAVYKVQTRSSIKDKQVKEKVPSPVSSLVGKKCSPILKKCLEILMFSKKNAPSEIRSDGESR